MPAATFVSGSPGGSHPLSFQQHAKEVSFGCQVQLFVVGWQGPVVAPARWAFLSKTPAHLGLRQDSHRIQNPRFSFTLNRVMSCYWHTGSLTCDDNWSLSLWGSFQQIYALKYQNPTVKHWSGDVRMLPKWSDDPVYQFPLVHRILYLLFIIFICLTHLLYFCITF